MISVPNTEMRIHANIIRYAKLAADQCGFEFSLLDTHSGYLCRIVNGNKSIILGAGSVSSWPINNVSAANIACDKSFTNLILRDAGIAVPKDEKVFLSKRFSDLRESGREMEDVGALLTSLNWPLVVKPNNGSRGAFVQLCSDIREVRRHLEKMALRYDIGLLQNFVGGQEYRVFVFGSDAVFSYKKYRAALVADGVSTLRQLVTDENIKLIGFGLDPIDIDSIPFMEALKLEGLGPDAIPAMGSRFIVGVRANLTAGGTPKDFTTEPSKEIADVALKAVRVLGLEVAGVDIIVPDGTPHGIPVVLEVNSNPSISSLESIGRIDLAVSIIARLLTRLLSDTAC